MQEARVQAPGQEDPLEQVVTTHSSILAWEIPWTEEPGGLQSTGSQKGQTQLNYQTITNLILYAPWIAIRKENM